jgi:hypothetical protein
VHAQDKLEGKNNEGGSNKINSLKVKGTWLPSSMKSG